MDDLFKLLKIDHYSEKFSSDHQPLLDALERETQLSTTNPRMCSGYIQGRLLSMISKLKQPKYILEIGTFTGYATLCMAEGLTDEGRIFTLDVDEETTKIAQRFFNQSKYASQIQLIIGDALKIIPNINEAYDLVFIDADKQNYITYLDMVLPRLRPGGIIIADNVLWSGKVTEKNMDKKTKYLHDFNIRVSSDPDLINFILPIRDGLNVIFKK